MKIDDKCLDWAKKEITERYGRYTKSMQTRLEYDVLMSFYTHHDADFNKCINDISRLLMNRLPLISVENREEDWEWNEKEEVYIHRHMPFHLCKIKNTVVNLNRFIVCDISKKDTPEYRQPTDREIEILHVLYPIQFPYYQTRDGVLYISKADKYISFMKYKDECAGEWHDIFKHFDTSTEFWKEVPFSECSKYMVEVIGEA